MDKILKTQIPEKVYESYVNQPKTKRIMYDLVAQGVAQGALDMFFEKYDSLPFVEQTRLDNDPAAWGTAFNSTFESFKRKSAKSASENAGSEHTPSTPMASVSAGSTGRTRTPPPTKSALSRDSSGDYAIKSSDWAAEKKRILSGG